jgi:hypothetical protein
MKTIKIIQMRPGIIIGCIIALIILLGNGIPGNAARIAKTFPRPGKPSFPFRKKKQRRP